MIILEDQPFKLLFTDKTLSLSWKKDNPSKVKENWQRVKTLLNLNHLKIAYLSQIHGNNIKTVNNYGFQGWGDGLITFKNNVALVVFVADCIPLIFYEKESGLLGALHCGWRSLASGIIENLFKKLKSLKIEIKNIKFYLGPCINACCYQVGRDMKDYFEEYEDFFTIRNDNIFCDLKGIAKEKLKNIGAKTIYDISICTRCSNHYFSHRKGDRERQVGLIIKCGK